MFDRNPEINHINIIMNKLNPIIRFVVVLFLFLNVSLFASNSPKNAEIVKRIENLSTIIDVKVTSEVTEQIINYIDKHKRDAEKILGRTTLYFPMIENALREKNLPDELKYVAVIESSLIPHIESHQGAAGIWQFMKGTSELFGLKVTDKIDERYDIYKSTDKALDYLKILYESYGNWNLALAAYNCGTGNVNRAIKKANGSNNYWQISKYLPKETQKYIPRFIAVSYLMNYYYMHDIYPAEPSEDLKYILTVKVFDKIDFKKLSDELEMEYDLIKYLNPMYLKGYIPVSEDGIYSLTLPDVKMWTYVDKYNLVENFVNSPYIFRRSDSDVALAGLKSRTVEIPELSNIQSNTSIKDNLKDDIFIQKLKDQMIIDQKPIEYHRLNKKESLLSVAQSNNMTLKDLMEINKIKENDQLAPGSMIRISR